MQTILKSYQKQTQCTAVCAPLRLGSPSIESYHDSNKHISTLQKSIYLAPIICDCLAPQWVTRCPSCIKGRVKLFAAPIASSAPVQRSNWNKWDSSEARKQAIVGVMGLTKRKEQKEWRQTRSKKWDTKRKEEKEVKMDLAASFTYTTHNIHLHTQANEDLQKERAMFIPAIPLH